MANTLDKRLQAFTELGADLRAVGEGRSIPSNDDAAELDRVASRVYQENGWFTEGHVRYAIKALGESLRSEKLEAFVEAYRADIEKVDRSGGREVAVVMPGNIPLAGAHDMFTVLLSGHRFQGKLSSKDTWLLSELAALLVKKEATFRDRIKLTPGNIKGFDAVIATGSNNTSRYFVYYLGRYPHIFRKNRNGVAVLTGEESDEELKALGHDVFCHFGMGCRNVSKLYLPEGFDPACLANHFAPFKGVMEHDKYANNYDHNKACYIMSDTPFMDEGFFLLKADAALASPLATLFYEHYRSKADIEDLFEERSTEIQCIVSRTDLPFGTTQQPELWNHADGVDTMRFLVDLEQLIL